MRKLLLGGFWCVALAGAVGCGDDGDDPTGPVVSCTDGIENGTETDVDCGGDCAACAEGLACDGADDCVSGNCVAGVCGRSRCNDDVVSGRETDVDCGGPDCLPCPTGGACLTGNDCLTLSCERTGGDTGTCVNPCTDGRVSAGERGVDCGGICAAPCPDGTGCEASSECLSGVCELFLCQEPACDDRIANGDESDRDCGGAECAGCAPGRACRTGADCASQICQDDLRCAEPACDDGFQNGDETDVDCGGQSCGPCPTGGACMRDGDCVSKVCDDETDRCAAPTCDDAVANGDESDVDCGGPDCAPCANLRRCFRGADCTAGSCFIGYCGSPTIREWGTDRFGYVGTDFTWPGTPCPDIRTTGVPLTLTDSGFATVTLPFDFEFYGVVETTAYIQANGMITFGSALAMTDTNWCLPFIPSTWQAQIDRFIAPWWINFNPDPMSSFGGGGVYWQTIGTAPNRRFVVQWNAKYSTSTPADALGDVRVVLEEGTNKISMCYIDVDVGIPGTWDGGLNASSGIQQSRSGSFLQYHCRSLSLRSGLTVEYTP